MSVETALAAVQAEVDAERVASASKRAALQQQVDDLTKPVPVPNPPPAPDPPPAGKHFTATDGALYRPDGTEFYGLGVNLFPTQVPNIALAQDSWKMNIIRCNCIPKDHNILWTDGQLDSFIQACTDRKIPVIATYHVAGDINFTTDGAAVDAFHNRLIAKDPGNPYRWHSVWNEYSGPGKITRADGTRDFNDPAAYIAWGRARIANIRNKGGKQPIVVSALSWAQDLADRSTRPFSAISSVLLYGPQIAAGFDNIVFDVHLYNDYSHSAKTVKEFVDAARAAKLAILFGETGVSNAKEDCTVAQLKLFDAIAAGKKVLGIGWHGQANDGNFFTTDKNLTVKTDAAGKPTNLSPMGQRFWNARGYGR